MAAKLSVLQSEAVLFVMGLASYFLGATFLRSASYFLGVVFLRSDSYFSKSASEITIGLIILVC